MKQYDQLKVIVTDRLRSCAAAMKVVGNVSWQETDRWKNNHAENSHLPFQRRGRATSRFRSTHSLQNVFCPCAHFKSIQSGSQPFAKMPIQA